MIKDSTNHQMGLFFKETTLIKSRAKSPRWRLLLDWCPVPTSLFNVFQLLLFFFEVAPLSQQLGFPLALLGLQCRHPGLKLGVVCS